MRPDRRQPIARDDRSGPRPVPFDVASDPAAAELEAMAAELATTGARARAVALAGGSDAPTAAFAADLRSRLISRYATAAVDGSPGPAARTDEPGRLTLVDRVVVLASARRWAIVVAAAVVALAILGTAGGRMMTAPLDARAGDVDGVTLVRAGVTRPLAAGTALRALDEIRVDASGQATIVLAGGETRLAGGADIRIEELSTDRVLLTLLAGRSYHRVVVPAGASYVVSTGAIRWAALGTAFELDREPAADGTERVTFIAVQHAVSVAGPDLGASVGEGRTATLILGPDGPTDLAIGLTDRATLLDPWLLENVQRDRDLGFPIGSSALSPSPTAPPVPPQPSVGGQASPSSTPASTPGVSPSGRTTERSSPPAVERTEPTVPPAPTPRPTPRPPARLGLRLLSCDGGVVIDWSAFRGRGFDRYVTLRGTGDSVPADYPPHAGVTVVEGASTTERWRTNAHDVGLADGTYAYRTLALDGEDRVVGSSGVRIATARPIDHLGPLTVGPGESGTTVFSWTPFAGPAACFDVAKLVYSESDSTPSYLDGAGVLLATTDQGLAEAVHELGPGTYHLRLQVLRATELGSPAKFVVAQTDVATYTVP